MQKLWLFRSVYILVLILSIIAFSVQANNQTGNFQVDIHSRENARNFYNTVYHSSNNESADWNGDLTRCNAGDSSQRYKAATLRRINYFRAMAGVPSWVRLSESANASARGAALLTSTNNALSHYPPASWKCYSFERAQGSASSNIALGKIGSDAITAYIEDAGRHNLSVGHRRWLLYPQTQVMGAGDVNPQLGEGKKASAITIIDSQYGSTRPQTRDRYVSWPPSGYVPYQLIFPRWSFSLTNADFSQASISVRLDNKVIQLEILPIETGYGENTIAWEIKSTDLRKPSTDLFYNVSIHNVLINGRYPKNYNYQVKAFDPARQGPDTSLSTISGAAKVKSGQTNQYQVSLTPKASSHQILTAQRSPYQHAAIAEFGLEQLKGDTTDAKSLISNFTSNSGQRSYQLSHYAGANQQLRFNRQFLVNPNANLVFYSRISCASIDETARVQVSLDDGSSWQDIYTQTGILYGLRESSFKPQSINLNAFAGKIIRIRFNYTSKFGWHCSIANSGWYLDDIILNNVEELKNVKLTNITETVFHFSSSTLSDYVIAARGILFNGFAGEWGKAFSVEIESNTSLEDQPIQLSTSTNQQIADASKSVNFSTRSNEACSLDVDENGSIDALTDGLMYIRHMLGNHGATLIENALGANCTRCKSSEIEIFLDQCATTQVADIDGNGTIDALTDGLLNIRFLFGIRGAALINGSVSDDCSRCSIAEIEDYLGAIST